MASVSPVSAGMPVGSSATNAPAVQASASVPLPVSPPPAMTGALRAAVSAQDGASLCARQNTAAGNDRAFGRLGSAVVAWACDPLAAVVGLPPTDLEREEPERLYALVTRQLAVEPLEYAPEDLVPLFGGPYQARQEVADQLAQLVDAAREAGHPDLHVNSGFRDYWTQAGTYEDWVRRSGSDQADRVSARPGHSEHQLGLAVDLTGTCGGFACFGDSPEGRWVAENTHRFGFIIRYPQDGAEITGYAYEPWHLRYVGPRAAWTMHLSGEVYWEYFAPIALEAATTGD